MTLYSPELIIICPLHKSSKNNSFIPHPNSKFAVLRDTVVQVFYAPGRTHEFNPFVLYRTFPGHIDLTTCLDWTSDSRFVFKDFQKLHVYLLFSPYLGIIKM